MIGDRIAGARGWALDPAHPAALPLRAGWRASWMLGKTAQRSARPTLEISRRHVRLRQTSLSSTSGASSRWMLSNADGSANVQSSRFSTIGPVATCTFSSRRATALRSSRWGCRTTGSVGFPDADESRGGRFVRLAGGIGHGGLPSPPSDSDPDGDGFSVSQHVRIGNGVFRWSLCRRCGPIADSSTTRRGSAPSISTLAAPWWT